MHTSPSLHAEHVAVFAAEVVPGVTPIPVPHRPRFDRSQRECFPIVEEHIAANGGTMVSGWALWEWSGVFIEAEFHAVWCGPDGTLLDLTPNRLLPHEIVFLPDPRTKYEGRQIDNVRKPLVKDNDLKRFLFIFKRQFEILNQGDLAFQHGPISLPPKALKELQSLHREGAKLERRLQSRYSKQAMPNIPVKALPSVAGSDECRL